MERRIEIYNKIKNTKISKLTLKQNGEAKTLNLKVDLLNENIFLSDKALDMLDNLANKQILSTDNSINQQKPIQTEIIQSPQITNNDVSDLYNYQQDNESHDTPISSQFFEKPDDVSIFLKNKMKLLTNKNDKIIKEFPPFSQIEVKSNNIITRIDNVEESDGHLCRLCQTKCPNERALHDHVTRIHGGSDYRRKHCLFLNNNNSSLFDDTNSDTNDELNSSNSNIMNNTSYSNNKKFKLMHEKQKKQQKVKKLYMTNSPKPNVAIRVAKVAYYNNKNSLNANNSKIFVNGIRGNFFSQERLPLKSCKIKLGIDEVSKQNSVKLTATEINKFFRSLLVYIPNEILTIDDLIKANRSNEELLRQVHSSILESKECGITIYDLKIKLSIGSMNLLMELLNISDFACRLLGGRQFSCPQSQPPCKSLAFCQQAFQEPFEFRLSFPHILHHLP